MRTITIKTFDGTQERIKIDDNHTVGQLMVKICAEMGLSNPLWYSMAREMTDDELEMAQEFNPWSTAKPEIKLRQMREKPHSDKQLKKLNHLQTLREQGLQDIDTFVLQRNLFFMDVNFLDSEDLDLLFVQTRDAILDGSLPVTKDEAVELAGIQAHIQVGDYNEEEKHRLILHEFRKWLPPEYFNIENIDMMIFTEHKKLFGIEKLEAKKKYIMKCRRLKTYGITFFRVEEEISRKDKLVTRLLGIKKEKVINMDANTKEILKTWPLTTIKRWATSSDGFHLDFGDYSKSYYSVKTDKGQQIALLLTSYGENISKQKKEKDRIGAKDREKIPVSPTRKKKVSHPDTPLMAASARKRKKVSGETLVFTGSTSIGQEKRTDRTKIPIAEATERFETSDTISPVSISSEVALSPTVEMEGDEEWSNEEMEGDSDPRQWEWNHCFLSRNDRECSICCNCRRPPIFECICHAFSLCEICKKRHIFEEMKRHENEVVAL